MRVSQVGLARTVLLFGGSAFFLAESTSHSVGGAVLLVAECDFFTFGEAAV